MQQQRWNFTGTRARMQAAVRWLCISDYGRALVGLLVGKSCGAVF
jgi:hypothetical protein